MNNPNSQNFSDGLPSETQPVFEPASAPTVSSEHFASGAPTGAPTYQPGFQPPPVAPPYGTPSPFKLKVPLDDTGDFSHRIPRWRWFMSLLLIGTYPALASLMSVFLRPHGKKKTSSALPSTVGELALFIGLDLVIFAVLWGLGWAFSRANKDELLLRWRNGPMPIVLGLAYSLGLRIAVMFAMVFVIIIVAIVFTAMGHDPKMLTKLIQDNSPNAETLFPKGALSNPLYMLFSITVLSFVAAGFREELWRTSCLAALRHLFPDSWSANARWITSIVLSSVIFGLGHVYQGAVGVGMTSIIGLGLGVMTWRYRSIWPSVWAHGFFDATSFVLAAVVSSKSLPTPHAWFGW